MKQTHVEANGITLNVIEEGDGPAVLFVHAFPDGWRDWRRQMAAVAAAGYRAISFGTADGMIKMRALEEGDLAKSVPNLQGYLLIEGVGHWPQLEAFEIVNEALVSFLKIGFQ